MTKSAFQTYRENLAIFIDVLNDNSHPLSTPIADNKWSRFEVVGHIYYWDKFLKDVMVPQIKANGVLPSFPNHDEYNKEAIDYIKRFNDYKEFQKEFTHTREELINELKKIDTETKFTIGEGKRRFNTESFLKMFCKHDQHHLNQIL
ncbi:DinB family protein [Sutcliffiella rhizosphaerae]|uniref:DinB-like domain-containing protein n=1 Tax=Sutcliffiella rhizosphaerae TaxID=2880967 RepID=A0ABM8YPH6_9BACI|nr:DinB family protein [Sutcliffiella rhizosphaerae]CAG9621886.1 hypothetical protein BACCIP111883_02677 [Sutcliffiella rhizosphaerae]